MGTTTTKISFEEFQRLQETAEETIRYELDEGELVLTPSPIPRHNIVSFRLHRVLAAFVQTHGLGMVISEIDFRLSGNTVRKPDVAFIARKQMKAVNIDKTPVEGAPRSP